jgi:hypothetical protein
MAPRGSRQKQLAVALPEDIRARVEAAAGQSGHSLAEEIRQRLERTVEDDAIDPETRKLMEAVELLAQLVKIQTGHSWFDHPAATSVMKHAIDARLARMMGGDGEATFLPDELPPKEIRFLAAGSDDPRMMAVALNTIAEFDNAFGVKRRGLAKQVLNQVMTGKKEKP